MAKNRLERYDSDKECLIKLLYLKNSNKRIEKTGLIHNESDRGCSAIFHKPFKLQTGDIFIMNIGEIKHLTGELKWVKEYDRVFVKAGIHIIVKDKSDK